MKNYWLIKSEPEVYSIDQMAKDKKTLWECIRNYQARNFMTKSMKLGDLAFFYHSNAKPPGIAGLVEVASSVKPDPTQFDKKGEYFEPRATKEKPVWECVEFKFVEKFAALVSLDTIKGSKSLAKMVLLNSSRLSVQPVTENEFKIIMKMVGGQNA